MSDRRKSWSRRELVRGLTLAGTAGLLGLRPDAAAGEPPLETRTLKVLLRRGNICQAGLLILAKEALHQEGFTDVQYVVKPTVAEYLQALTSGEGDISMQFSATAIVLMEEGAPIVFLAGIHTGCLELFGTDKIRAIRDLRGKTIAVPALRGPQHIFVASMLAHVGIDPRKDQVGHPCTG